MKKLENVQMEKLTGYGYDPFGCGLTLVGAALTFATIPTGFGAGLLLLGGASVVIAGIATSCNNPNR
ncbi:Vmc-like lipoprotein signal peptide domain-containing protein [Runella sp.]|uniref:Vmc-like lipoprotein signal peptide domain-containing protein n=1 Tax=Runella sp. TaxID=1960881 RepID=UPI003D14BA96